MSNDRGIRAVKISAQLAGSAQDVLSTAVRLCGWSLRDEGNQSVAKALSTDVAATNAGTLTLTGFQYVSLITVTPDAAWPAGNNVVTLTNVEGGTQSVEIQGGTTDPAIMSFPLPLATTGTAVVSVPAMGAGPDYTIEAVGTVAASSFPEGVAYGEFQDGSGLVAYVTPPTGGTSTVWLSDGGIYIGNRLRFKVDAGLIGGVAYVRDSYDWED